jgi:GT2 family glycosyltransferase/peptidoglycan/xylan/chitin deacetylase (PgdA/CDA1 family)
MSARLKLSVILATYNRANILARTLATILDQQFPADQYEVVVVVDGSSDGTLNLLIRLQLAYPLRILDQANRGQAVALNRAIRAARGDLIVFLDDDIVCGTALLREHLVAHEGLDSFVAFGPVLVSPESPPTLATDWTQKCSDHFAARVLSGVESQWPHVSAGNANTSVPRSALIACGGFDERLVGGLDDVDLGLRLWKMGLRFRYLQNAVVHQIYVKSPQTLVRTDARRLGRNEVRLCRKCPEYRPVSLLGSLREGPYRKQVWRSLTARLPVSPERILDLPSWGAERLRSVSPIRRVGIRLLELRQGIERLRGAAAEAGSWQALRAEFGVTLPVLLYHHVGPPKLRSSRTLTISPERFERQVRWLAHRGYVGIAPSDWLAWCRRGTTLPPKPVLLTFDDAYADIAIHALPLLKQIGFRGAVFVITKLIGGKSPWDDARLMTADQIKEWQMHGIEFGAHTRTHANLKDLSKEKLTDEIVGSKADLARVLGREPGSFAYPYGGYNRAVRDEAAHVCELAFTTDEGINTLKTDPFLLRRTMVMPSDSLADLECRLHWGWSPIEYLRAYVGFRTRVASVFRFLFCRTR